MSAQKSKFQITVVLTLVTLFLITGCSGKKSSDGSYDSYEEQSVSGSYNRNMSSSDSAREDLGFTEIPAGAAAARTDAAGADARRQNSNQQTIQTDSTSAPVKRKLIKQANLKIEADPSFIDSEGKLSGINQKVDELMKRYGAYSESTQSDENTVHFTIRVPEIFYESLIAGTSVLGKIRSRSETAQDVTIQYYDLEGRLNTKKALLQTFQGYLGRTKDINDIMKVETRISELQNEIDWLGSQLTRLANLVDYATVELTVSVYTYHDTPSYTFGDKVKQLLGGFGKFASGAALVIIGILVYAVPIVILCLIAFWLLFGRIGLLKKAFRYVMYGGKTKKEDKPKNSGGTEQ